MKVKKITVGLENDSFSPHISCEIKVEYAELEKLSKMPKGKANAKIGKELLSTLQTWIEVQKDLHNWSLKRDE